MLHVRVSTLNEYSLITRTILLKLSLLGTHRAPYRGAAGLGAASVPVEPGEAEG